jgi:hypothetical protein
MISGPRHSIREILWNGIGAHKGKAFSVDRLDTCLFT